MRTAMPHQHAPFPFRLAQSERAAIRRYLQGRGFDLDGIAAFAAAMACPAFWFDLTRTAPPLDYTPAVALYVRDFWRSDQPQLEGVEFPAFDAEMRVFTALMQNTVLTQRYSPAPDVETNLVDGLLSLLEQHAERLSVCWVLSRPSYALLPVNTPLLQALLPKARAEPVQGTVFGDWVLEHWLPMHLHHYAA